MDILNWANTHTYHGADCEDWYNDLKRVLTLYINAFPNRYTILSRDEYVDEHEQFDDATTWPEGLLHTRRYVLRYTQHQTRKNDIVLYLHSVPGDPDPSLNTFAVYSSGATYDFFNLNHPEFKTDKLLYHSLFLFFVDENTPLQFQSMLPWESQRHIDQYILWAFGYLFYEKRWEALAMSQQWQIREFMNSQLPRYLREFYGPDSSAGPYANAFCRDRIDATMRRIKDFLRTIQ